MAVGVLVTAVLQPGHANSTQNLDSVVVHGDYYDWGDFPGPPDYSDPYNDGFISNDSSSGGGDPPPTSTPGLTWDPNPNGECKGNPIVYSSGNKIEPEVDFASQVEMGLSLSRTYNHFWGGVGLFGKHWVSSLDYKLTFGSTDINACYPRPGGGSCSIGANTVIFAWRPDGRVVKYIRNATNGIFYEDKPGAVSTIEKQTDGTFLLQGEGNETEKYSSAGYIQSFKNPTTVSWTFSYNGTYPQRITHQSGRYIDLIWTGSQLTAVRDPAGNQYSYTYTANQFGTGIHRLASTTQPGTVNTAISYHYELSGDPGALTGKSFNGIRYSTFTYDANGFATSSEHNGADKYTFTYTLGANGAMTVAETNPLGKQSTYTFENGKLKSTTGHPSTYCPTTRYAETEYDANGYPLLRSGYDGSETSYAYNAKGQLIRKTEAYGTPQARTTEYVWDTIQNRILSETLVGVRKTEYFYSSDLRLSRIKTINLSSKGVSGETRNTWFTYDYRAPSSGTMSGLGMLLHAAVDGPLFGGSDTVSKYYDEFGNLASVVNMGHTTTFSNYDALGRPGRITNANGGIMDYTYDARGRVLTEKRYIGSTAYTATHTYDNRGRLTKTVAPDGVATSYFYDNNDRLTKITRPEPDSPYAAQIASLTGASSPLGYAVGAGTLQAEPLGTEVPGDMMPNICHPQPDCEDDPPAPANAASFVAQTVPATMVAGQTYAVTMQMKNTGTATWTAANSYNLGSANPLDNMTWGRQRVAVPGSIGPEQTATFSFNVTAPTTAGSYNFQWRMVRDGVAWFGVFTPNLVVTVQPAPVDNAIFVSQTVPASMIEGQVYPVSLQMKNTGNTTWTAANNYKLGSINPVDNTRWGTGRVPLSASIAPGATAIFSFNVTAPATAGSHNFQWRMLRENVGWFGANTTNVAVQVQPPPPPIGFKKFTYNLNGDVTSVQTGIEYQGETLVVTQTFIDYDELGRVRAERGNNGQLVKYEYDDEGTVKAVTDSLGKKTTNTYDALQRLTTTTDPLNSITRFEYDGGDRLTKVTDPRGKATTYEYDGFDQLWRQTSPDTGITSYAYDEYGQRTTMTRADGVVTTYAYDGFGRLIGLAAGSESQSFVYDTCTGGKGLLCQVLDPKGQLDYTYTPHGWLLTQKQRIGGSSGWDQTFTYDGMGRATAVAYPNSVSVGYTYTNGRLSTMTATVGGATKAVVSDLAYQPFGPMVSLTYGNGLTRGYNFDTDRRLTGISTKNGSSVLQSLTFGYNKNNDITGITNAANAGLSQTYGYDDLARLTAVTLGGSPSQSWLYDANGNRTQHVWGGQTDAYTVSTGNNRLVGIDGPRAKAFTHNVNGNITTAGDATYDYNPLNRLTQAIRGGVTTTYWVNALGQRTYKTPGTGYGYGPDGSLVMEYGWGGVGWSHYLRLGGEPIALVRGGQLYYLHDDQLGRPEIATNSAKSVVWRASNYAFDRMVTVDTIGGLNLGLPGQYYDAETGNWHNGFRDYDASVGRYLQSDPIGLAGGLNTYAYVASNPANNSDRSGLECNERGCWVSDIERRAAENGDWDIYYQSACNGGDSYACRAYEVATQSGATRMNHAGALFTNIRLANSLLKNNPALKTCPAALDQKMDDIRTALVRGHMNTLDVRGATPTNPITLSGQDIANFHYSAFSANGASPGVFGGDFLNIILGTTEGRWLVNQAFTWCSLPSCQL